MTGGALPEDLLPFVVVGAAQGLFASLAPRAGNAGEPVDSGNVEFDARYPMISDAPERAGALLADPSVRAAIEACGVAPDIDGERITIHLPIDALDAAAMARGRALVEALAAAVALRICALPAAPEGLRTRSARMRQHLRNRTPTGGWAGGGLLLVAAALFGVWAGVCLGVGALEPDVRVWSGGGVWVGLAAGLLAAYAAYRVIERAQFGPRKPAPPG
ncbi:hypothetical protein LBMAG42_26860 [Deltaproteobacteria bacterium]|nr:hypothetical protein LBMAG42_26860 [Deltaproteobacteria bacterium]